MFHRICKLCLFDISRFRIMFLNAYVFARAILAVLENATTSLEILLIVNFIASQNVLWIVRKILRCTIVITRLSMARTGFICGFCRSRLILRVLWEFSGFEDRSYPTFLLVSRIFIQISDVSEIQNRFWSWIHKI